MLQYATKMTTLHLTLPVAVMVRFDCYSGPTLSDGSVPICSLRRTWFASYYQCSRLQVPLKLAWAVTIHKSQGMTLDKAVIDMGRKEFSSGLTFVACSRVRHMCDLLFVPPFRFQRVANLSKSNRLKDRLQEDVRLSCLTTTMPVHDSNITTTLASGLLPSLNTTEHPSSTTAPSITDLPKMGKNNNNLPSFQIMPQKFQMMEQPVFQKVLIVPTTALSSFQTLPQRFQMMEQPLFQRAAVIVPTTVLSLIFKQLEMKK